MAVPLPPPARTPQSASDHPPSFLGWKDRHHIFLTRAQKCFLPGQPTEYFRRRPNRAGMTTTAQRFEGRESKLGVFGRTLPHANS